MTLRVALAVLLAVALVAAALPAARDATGAAARRRAAGGASRVADAVETLAASSDPVPRGESGAHRRVRLALDAPAPGGTAVDYVAVGGVPNRSLARDGEASDVVAYRVRGRQPRVARGLGIDVRVVENGSVRPDDVPLLLRDDAVVVVRLVRYHGTPTVLVSRRRPGESLNPRPGPADVCATC